jgi:hypothetical protein
MASDYTRSYASGRLIPLPQLVTNGDLSANDSLGLLSNYSPTHRTLSSMVTVHPYTANVGDDDSSNLLEFLTAPASSLQRNINSSYANTYNPILQQHATYSMKDQTYISPQMTLNTNMSFSDQIDGDIVQSQVSNPDPKTEPAREMVPSRFPKTCKWEGCKHTRSFSREADLVRHIKTVHISPGSYICPEVGCRKACSRKDNLEAHRQRVHGKRG